ncbi:iron chelate uptake ABC transporter family permease subunit [Peribacillus frigoritolerans]|nr:iron chelate uptake ABC transporter family permease subunit [Peribacillus frigoritolerans]
MKLKRTFGLKSTLPPYSIILLLTVTVLILAIVSLGLGAIYISPLEILQNFLGNGMQSQTFILHNYRIPRILIAVIVGAGLATAGAILQGVLRNPLASPDVIGVTKGGRIGSSYRHCFISAIAHFHTASFSLYRSGGHGGHFDDICL